MSAMAMDRGRRRRAPAPSDGGSDRRIPGATQDAAGADTGAGASGPPRYFLSVEQAAQSLGIKRDSLYKLISGPRPELASRKIGARRLIPVWALEEYAGRGRDDRPGGAGGRESEAS